MAVDAGGGGGAASAGRFFTTFLTASGGDVDDASADAAGAELDVVAHAKTNSSKLIPSPGQSTGRTLRTPGPSGDDQLEGVSENG